MVCWTNSIRVKVWFCKVIIKIRHHQMPYFLWLKRIIPCHIFEQWFLSRHFWLTHQCLYWVFVVVWCYFYWLKKCSWLCRSRVWFFLLASLFMSDKGLEWYLLVLGYQQNRRIQVFWHNRHWVYRILMCTFRFGKWQWYHIADSRI